MLNLAPDRLAAPIIRSSWQREIVAGRFLGVLSWQSVTERGVTSWTVNLHWTWRR